MSQPENAPAAPMPESSALRPAPPPAAPPAFAGIALVLLIGLIATGWRRISRGDVLFNLRAGQSILKSLQIPTVDPYSATASGTLWSYFSWLWGEALAQAYAVGEWAALNGITLALSAGLTLALLIRASRRGSRLFEATICTMLALLAVFPVISPSPLFLALLIFVILAEIAESQRSRWIFVPYFILTILWANVHISAPLALLFPALRLFWPRPTGLSAPNRQGEYPRVFLLIILIACALGLVITPHSDRAFSSWAAAVQAAANVAGQTLQESLHNPESILSLGSVALFTIVALLGRGLRPFQAVVAVLITAAGFLFPEAWCFATLYLAGPAAVGLTNLMTRTWSAPNTIRTAAATSMLLTCVAGLAGVLLATRTAPSTFGRGVKADIFPETAAGRLAALPLRGTIFNKPGDGDYLIWRLWPAWKVAIDERPGRYDTAFLKDYEALWRGAPNWQNWLAMWRVFAVLGPADLSIKYPGHNLYTELALSPDWVPVYWDADSVLYLHKTVDFANTNFEAFRVLKPGLTYKQTIALATTPQQKEQLHADLRRAIQDDPTNITAQQFLEQLDQ